jgi:hypothetical protein
MKSGHVPGVHTSTSRETWLSTPLSDSNACLWASIAPPANPTLTTAIRRRAVAFSLDMLSYKLQRRFPGTFSTRSTARGGILAAALAFGAGLATVGYLALASSSLLASGPHALAASSVVSQLTTTRSPARGDTRSARYDEGADTAPAASTGRVRLGETEVEPVSGRAMLRATLAGAGVAGASASADAGRAAPVAQHAATSGWMARTALAKADATAPVAKAKRAVSKKKAKLRRAKPRRAPIASE